MNETGVVAIIQARIGSTRFPRKVLQDLCGKPLISHILNRVKLIKSISRIVLAIPITRENDIFEKIANDFNCNCFRGSEEDVLSRYYEAAKTFKAEIIVRLTSDCPLIDPKITEMAIENHLHSQVDYTAVGFEGGFPRGLDTEIFNFDVIEKTYNEAHLIYEREHVTPYIYHHPHLFKLRFLEATGKLRRPDLRLTVDEREDLELIRAIFETLNRDGQTFYTEEVIDLLDKYPHLLAINAHVVQKELGK
jgi:spore coat polysaccharide biosynthesis protein SpsF